MGDYIYMPARTSQIAQNYSLSVAGLMRADGEDEPSQIPYIAGGTFGIYVMNAKGEMTPWANPLYPTQPMRIVSLAEETFFSLPEGQQFYIRQESAPQGYQITMPDYYEVTSSQTMAFTCAQPSELVITVADMAGTPYEGAKVALTDERGSRTELATNASGQVTISYLQPGTYTVEEIETPTGAIALDEAQKTITLGAAQRGRVDFTHMQLGHVIIDITASMTDGDGTEIKDFVYDDYSIHLTREDGSFSESYLPDEQGRIDAALAAGSYVVNMESTNKDFILSLSQAVITIENGLSTPVELTAVENGGRVVLSIVDTLENGSDLSSAQMVLVGSNGEEFGPYHINQDGNMVSSLLPEGTYTLKWGNTPSVYQADETVSTPEGNQPLDACTLSVALGEVTESVLALKAICQQPLTVLGSTIEDDGTTSQVPLSNASLEIMDESGKTVETITVDEHASATIPLLSGTYQVRVLNVPGYSDAVATLKVPDQSGKLAISSDYSRIRVAAQDQFGARLTGAVYRITDGENTQFEIRSDEKGFALSDLVAAGEARIEVVQAPEGYAPANDTYLSAMRGELTDCNVVFTELGKVEITVSASSLSDEGTAYMQRLQDVQIDVLRLKDGGNAENQKDYIETGLHLNTDADGMAEAKLASGTYLLRASEAILDDAYDTSALMAAVHIVDGTTTSAELSVASKVGGLRVTFVGGDLTIAQLAQIRFSLVEQNSEMTELQVDEEGFIALDLPEGVYTLVHEQMIEGYNLAMDRTVEIAGGQLTYQPIALEEYGTLSVDKRGMTFNQDLQAFSIPITGTYGVYKKEGAQIVPYPSEQEQLYVLANTTGAEGTLTLPASLEGTTYLLIEDQYANAGGYLPDEQTHEATLYAGEQTVVQVSVAADKGFFVLSNADASSGALLSGGEFSLYRVTDGVLEGTSKSVLDFKITDGQYQNEMALPAGKYDIIMTKAPDGYALDSRMLPTQIEVEIEPYLEQGGTVSVAMLKSSKFPSDTDGTQLAAQLENGEDTAKLYLRDIFNGTLYAPIQNARLDVALSAQESAIAGIERLSIGTLSDAQGGRYGARVLYRLVDSGWQFEDIRMEHGLDAGSKLVDLSEVDGIIDAVSIMYFNEDTGLEALGSCFYAQEICIETKAYANSETVITANVDLTYDYEYKMSDGVQVQSVKAAVHAQADITRAADESMDDAGYAGKDGHISGLVFIDVDADGLLSFSEQTLELPSLGEAWLYTQDASGTWSMYDQTTITQDGQYSFGDLPFGKYEVTFSLPEGYMFTLPNSGAPYLSSAVVDKAFGSTNSIQIDERNTSYCLNAGLVEGASVLGSVLLLTQDGGSEGISGVEVSILDKESLPGEEVFVTTDEHGLYKLDRLYPGEYTLTITLPDHMAIEALGEHLHSSFEQTDNSLSASFTLSVGDRFEDLDVMLVRVGEISGNAFVDEDYDGHRSASEPTLSGVVVKLLEIDNASAKQIGVTQTAQDGTYSFGKVYEGTYELLFELPQSYVFTRGGGESVVQGAVSQSGVTDSFVLGRGEIRADMSIGATLPASMQVNIFKDTNSDGLHVTSEPGLSGVEISLVRLENGLPEQRVTYISGEDGTTQFNAISPGAYCIEYRMPDAWRISSEPEGQGLVQASTQPSGASEVFTLSSGQNDMVISMNAIMSSTITGTVFGDVDDNGLLDAGETGIEGVLVELIDHSTKGIVASTATNAEGIYAFEGVPALRYQVRFTGPDGTVFSGTEYTRARNYAVTSDTNSSTTDSIMSQGGKTISGVNAGIVFPGEISGLFYIDANNNGAKDDDESGLEGVSITLSTATGRSLGIETRTGGDGSYRFSGVRPGSYTLRITLPGEYEFTVMQPWDQLTFAESSAKSSLTQPFSLVSKENLVSQNWGTLLIGSISGNVWADADYDGVYAESEEGLRGAVVELINMQGEVVGMQNTARDGAYSFDGLMPGEYILRSTLSNGYVYTVSGGDSVMLRSDERVQMTSPISLSMGAALGNIRIGAVAYAELSGTIWIDSNDSGRKDRDEAKLSGVRISLLSGDEVILQTSSDENGDWSLTSVLPGTYVIAAQLPEGYAYAKNASGTSNVSMMPISDDMFSRGDQMTVLMGEKLTNLNIGATQMGSVSGEVWLDETYDGQRKNDEHGLAGVSVRLLNGEGISIYETQTIDDGLYSFGRVRRGTYRLSFELPDNHVFTKADEGALIAQVDERVSSSEPFTFDMGEVKIGCDVGAIESAQISGKLWSDSDGDQQISDGEEGISNALVELMCGGTVVASQKTGDDGAYAFGLVRPNDYLLLVTLPDHCLFAENVQIELGDPDDLQGQTQVFAISMGETKSDINFPVVYSGSISGCAFEDDNVNGLNDYVEPVLLGTRVELLKRVDGEHVKVAETAVDANGEYTFTHLRSGQYAVRFTLPGGYLFTQEIAHTPERNSDAFAMDGNVAETADFILQPSDKIENIDVGAIRPARLGDTVFVDLNANGLIDYEEPLLPGVEITIYKVDDNGALVTATTCITDAYGYYRVNDLRPGNYVIGVALPEGYTFTLAKAEGLDEIDSDITNVLEDGSGQSDVFTLYSGQKRLNIDIGLVKVQ